MTGDIVFLLIFVILPTALIVSGVWLILFIRREPEARAIERQVPAQHQHATETEQTEAILPEPASEAEPLSASTTGGDDPGEPAIVTPTDDEGLEIPVWDYEPASDQDAIQEVSPLAADLLYDEPGRDEQGAIDDSRLIELLEPADRELMEEQIGVEDQPAEQEQAEQTEEIPGVPAPGSEVADAEDATLDLPEVQTDDVHDEWQRPPEGGDREVEASAPQLAGDIETDQAEDEGPGEASEDDDDRDEGDEDDESDDVDQRQRQPGIRLLPTGEAERRRGRTSGRRVPPIGRLNRRDEGSVESGDSPPDVSSGYSE